jgi:hypothetical protein
MRKNPMLDRLAKKEKQPRSYWAAPKKEKKLAIRVKGRTTNASGSKNEKGDVRKTGIARLEHKTCQRKSFSVTREMIEKIVNASLACDEIPALVIEFINADTGKSEGEVAVVPVDDLLRLLNNEQ